MKTISLICKSFMLTGICVLVCQSFILPEAGSTGARKDQKPEAVLCGLTPVIDSDVRYFATVSQITAMDSFCVQYSGKLKPRIISYNMTTVPKLGHLEHMICTGNSFHAVTKGLSKLHPGDMIFFDNIKALDVNGKEILLAPISVSLR